MHDHVPRLARDNQRRHPPAGDSDADSDLGGLGRGEGRGGGLDERDHVGRTPPRPAPAGLVAAECDRDCVTTEGEGVTAMSDGDVGSAPPMTWRTIPPSCSVPAVPWRAGSRRWRGR